MPQPLKLWFSLLTFVTYLGQMEFGYRPTIPKVRHSEGPQFRRSAILSSKLCVRSPRSGSQAAKPSEAENLLAFRRRKEAKNLALGGIAQQFLPIDAMYITILVRHVRKDVAMPSNIFIIY